MYIIYNQVTFIPQSHTITVSDNMHAYMYVSLDPSEKDTLWDLK